MITDCNNAHCSTSIVLFFDANCCMIGLLIVIALGPKPYASIISKHLACFT
jgi:hypothetical protein